MKQVDALLGAAVRAFGGEGGVGEAGPFAAAGRGALAKHVRRAHRAQVADQRGEGGVAKRDPVDIHHRHDEPGRAEQPGER
jgi:hypothetical protein